MGFSSAWYRVKAGSHGRMAKRLLKDGDDVELVVRAVILAAHCANQAINIRHQAEAPIRQILANREATRARLASTPRCTFRRVQAFTDEKTGKTSHQVGDPCGGKLKLKHRHGTLTGAECALCGRFYPVAVPTPEQASAEVPA